MAEAKAMVKAMQLVEEKSYDKVIFEGDSWNVVLALEGNDEVVHWRAAHSTWQTRHVSRMYNRASSLCCSIQWAVDNDIPCGYAPNSQLPLAPLCDCEGTVDNFVCCD